jgi:hypothetical protein
VNDEVEKISAMIAEGKQEQEPCRKTLIAMKLFHYLEHHHYALKYREGFKEIVCVKALEFTMDVKDREDALRRLDKHTADYGRAEYLYMVSKALKEACDRVMVIIRSL